MNLTDLIPVAGMIISVIAAAAVARHQIRKLEIDAEKSATRLDAQDVRLDKLTTASEMHDQRLGILAGILSPAELERRYREIEAMRKDIEWIRKKVDTL